MDSRPVAFTGFSDVVEVTWVSTSAANFHQFDDVLVQTAPLTAQGVDLGSFSSTLPAPFAVGRQRPEPASGTTDAVIELALSRPHSAPLVVQYSTVAGNAAAGADYVAQSNLLVTFLAGQTRASVTVPVLGDMLDEADEVFFVRVDSAVGMRQVRGFGVVTILAESAAARGRRCLQPGRRRSARCPGGRGRVGQR